jgi:hypothetical protein
MATYVYETIPRQDGETPRRFEVRQSMKDVPLTRHPDTGEAVKRVISGGYGLMMPAGKNQPVPTSSPAPCATGCACHNGPRLPQP